MIVCIYYEEAIRKVKRRLYSQIKYLMWIEQSIYTVLGKQINNEHRREE